jgi:hypothetical protein
LSGVGDLGSVPEKAVSPETQHQGELKSAGKVREKVKTLFWYQNGEYRVEKYSFAYLRTLVRHKEPIKEEGVAYSSTGYWRVEEYEINGKKLIFEFWIPALGYCWEEIVVSADEDLEL